MREVSSAAAAVPLALLALLLAASQCAAKPEDWKQPGEEPHWAAKGCTDLTSKGMKYEQHNEICHTCVTDTKDHGDPTRCHQCMKHHGGNMPHELVEACLVCVAPMERKHLGWACSQYCAHHTIINDKEQSMDCVECLAADLPTDKWYCHVCMEQVIHSMDARRQCYACTQSGTDGYECATCGKVGNMEERAKCFECIKGGGKATECSKDYVKMPGYTKPPKTKAATPEAKLTSAEHPAAHADTL